MAGTWLAGPAWPGARGVSKEAEQFLLYVARAGAVDGHCVEHLIQQLERAVQMDLHPARGLLDGLARVVGAPALHKR